MSAPIIPTTKVWQKDYTLDDLASRYTAGDDVALDNRLVAPDVWGSMAHARMLNAIGIITDEETTTLLTGLARILDLFAAGEFVVTPADEDVRAPPADPLWLRDQSPPKADQVTNSTRLAMAGPPRSRWVQTGVAGCSCACS